MQKSEYIPNVGAPASWVIDHPRVIASWEASWVHAMAVLILEVVRLKLVCQNKLLV